MSKNIENPLVNILTWLILAFIIALTGALSWAFVAFFVWLITLCFGLQFTFLFATGVWLVILFAALVYDFISK